MRKYYGEVYVGKENSPYYITRCGWIGLLSPTSRLIKVKGEKGEPICAKSFQLTGADFSIGGEFVNFSVQEKFFKKVTPKLY